MSWGNPSNWNEKAVAGLLRPASAVYGLVTAARLLAYQNGILKQSKLPATVLSVGNITCGGTGKTPVTIDLAQRLVEAGRSVAVLSRGYKRRSTAKYLVVSDGKEQLAGCADSGDEPFLIAKSVPGCVVIVGSQRVLTAAIAINDFQCDTILLDDGFQHLPIHRDEDIVLIDYSDDLSKDNLLPAGRLREPSSALARATWIVITKVPEDADLQRLERMRDYLTRLNPVASISACRMTTDALTDLNQHDENADSSVLRDARVVAFSAIAKPNAFTAQLQELGADVVTHRSFPDHHWYTAADMQAIRELLVKYEADTVVTTEKDAVKLDPNMVGSLPLMILKQRLEWLGPVPVADLIGRTLIKPTARTR